LVVSTISLIGGSSLSSGLAARLPRSDDVDHHDQEERDRRSTIRLPRAGAML